MPGVIISVQQYTPALKSTTPPSSAPEGTLLFYNNGGVYFSVDSNGKHRRLTNLIDEIDIDFYEGNNPPYIADVDSFGMQDAAGFPVGEDRDVIFKMGGAFSFWEIGTKIDLIFAPSITDVGTNLRFQLDYVVHNNGESFNGGISYNQTADIPIGASINQLQKSEAFTLPSGQISDNTVEVEFRLSRLGSDINDTFGGDIGLKHVVAKSS